MKNQKGITLVALVITIVVLVILVGVTLTTAINTGLIDNAKVAIGKYEEEQSTEQAKITQFELLSGGSISGEDKITLEETISERTINYKIYGNSIQNGDPTIENPAEIQSVGDKTKNLFNVNDKSGMPFAAKILEDDWIRASYDNTNGTSTYYANIFTNPSNEIKPNTKYRVVCEVKEISNASVYPISSHTYKPAQFSGSVVAKSVGTYVWTVTSLSEFAEESSLLRSQITVPVGQAGYAIFRISLLEDTTVTADTFEYEPYYEEYKIQLKVNDEVKNIYLDEPLRKIGEYQDCIDFETQTISRRIVERTFDGSEGWFLGSGNNSYGNIMALKLDHNRTTSPDALCNRCLAVAGSVATPNGSTMRMIYGGGNDYIYFFVPTSIATTAAEWKTWLSENNLTVVYALKDEPEPTNIELPEIKTVEGTTNIEVLTNISPSKIELSY